MADPVETRTKPQTTDLSSQSKLPLWLLVFSYLLMGPGIGINCAFLAFAIPAMAQFGLSGLVIAFAIGMVLGIPAAVLLARRIHAGISKK